MAVLWSLGPLKTKMAAAMEFMGNDLMQMVLNCLMNFKLTLKLGYTPVTPKPERFDVR